MMVYGIYGAMCMSGLCNNFVCRYRVERSCLYDTEDDNYCERECKMRRIQPDFACINAWKCKRDGKHCTLIFGGK